MNANYQMCRQHLSRLSFDELRGINDLDAVT
jgi:hypothetical protein